MTANDDSNPRNRQRRRGDPPGPPQNRPAAAISRRDLLTIGSLGGGGLALTDVLRAAQSSGLRPDAARSCPLPGSGAAPAGPVGTSGSRI